MPVGAASLGLIKPHNSPASVILRSNSFTSSNDIQKKLIKVNNSCNSLKKYPTRVKLDEAGRKDFYSLETKINYQEISTPDDINAENYIYYGASPSAPINELGLTLDKNGHLQIIKGKSHDLFVSLYNNLRSRKRYKIATLSPEKKGSCPELKSLYLNEDGLLIGKEKHTNKLFNITISKKTQMIDTEYGSGNIKVTYERYHGQDPEKLNFQSQDGGDISFDFKDGILYLQSVNTKEKNYDYSLLGYNIKLPISKNYKVSSVKKTQSRLQIELSNGKKRKIVYLTPLEISMTSLKARHLSHKPPQNLSSRLGADPHERVDSGQPFSSKRYGNFNSRYIILFSYFIDNYRTNHKKAARESARGETKERVCSEFRSYDPGVESVLMSGKHAIRAGNHEVEKFINNISNGSQPQVANEEKHYHKNSNTMLTHQERMNDLLNSIAHNNNKKLSEKLLNFIKKTAPAEELAIDIKDGYSFFAGVAQAGMPLSSGWFAGVVAGLMTSHKLKIIHDVDGSFRFCFENKKQRGITALAGTGQGLEDICKLYSANSVDYVTVMPLEALAILSLNYTKQNNFSFKISKENLHEFVETFFNPDKISATIPDFTNDIELKKYRETEIAARIEAKVEVRLQAGTMVNDNTYMVSPRLALGVGAGLNLFSLKFSDEETLSDPEPKHKSQIRLAALGIDNEVFTEQKVMPILIFPDGKSGKTYCIPVPTTEEKSTRYRSDSQPLFVKEWNKETALPEESKKAQQTEALSINRNTGKSTAIADKSHQNVAAEDKASGRKNNVGSGSSILRRSSVDVQAEPDASQRRQPDAYDNQKAASQAVSAANKRIPTSAELRAAIMQALPDGLARAVSPGDLPDIALTMSVRRSFSERFIDVFAKKQSKSSLRKAAKASPVLAQTRRKLKELKKFCSGQERVNLHKIVANNIQTTYVLSQRDRVRRARLLDKVAGIDPSVVNDESIEKIKKEIAELKKSASYYLKDISVSRVSARALKSNLPLAVVNLNHECQLSYQQPLGQLRFRYDENTLSFTEVVDDLKCIL